MDRAGVPFPAYEGKKQALESMVQAGKSLAAIGELEYRKKELETRLKPARKLLMQKSSGSIISVLLGLLCAGSAVYSYATYGDAAGQYRSASSSSAAEEGRTALTVHRILFYGGISLGAVLIPTGGFNLIDPQDKRGIKSARSAVTELEKDLTGIKAQIRELKKNAGTIQ
ncbi:MAG: hypothetical protein E4H36_10675 [Spirochaetales bacterium]|nr:MAG: hypothetical protein E4H36_10675 [Spirochaetales bacterium]